MHHDRSAIATATWTSNNTFTWTAISGNWAQSVPLTWTRPTLVLGDLNMSFAQHRQAVGSLEEFCAVRTVDVNANDTDASRP